MQSPCDFITERLWFWCVPAGHGSGAGAPSVQYAPPSHGLHAVWPGRSWKVPGEHSAPSPLPSTSAKLPGRQSSHVAFVVAASRKLAFPLGQRAHAEMSLLPRSPLYVPAGHAASTRQHSQHCRTQASDAACDQHRALGWRVRTLKNESRGGSGIWAVATLWTCCAFYRA